MVAYVILTLKQYIDNFFKRQNDMVWEKVANFFREDNEGKSEPDEIRNKIEEFLKIKHKSVFYQFNKIFKNLNPIGEQQIRLTIKNYY